MYSRKLYKLSLDYENNNIFLKECINFCKKIGYGFIASIAIKISRSQVVSQNFFASPECKVISKYDKIHMFYIFLNGKQHFGNKRIKVKKNYFIKNRFV